MFLRSVLLFIFLAYSRLIRLIDFLNYVSLVMSVFSFSFQNVDSTLKSPSFLTSLSERDLCNLNPDSWGCMFRDKIRKWCNVRTQIVTVPFRVLGMESGTRDFTGLQMPGTRHTQSFLFINYSRWRGQRSILSMLACIDSCNVTAGLRTF